MKRFFEDGEYITISTILAIGKTAVDGLMAIARQRGDKTYPFNTSYLDESEIVGYVEQLGYGTYPRRYISYGYFHTELSVEDVLAFLQESPVEEVKGSCVNTERVALETARDILACYFKDTEKPVPPSLVAGMGVEFRDRPPAVFMETVSRWDSDGEAAHRFVSIEGVPVKANLRQDLTSVYHNAYDIVAVYDTRHITEETLVWRRNEMPAVDPETCIREALR